MRSSWLTTENWSLGKSWDSAAGDMEAGVLTLGEVASDEIGNIIYTIIMTKFVKMYF